MNLDPITSLVQAYLSDADILAIKIMEGESITVYLGKDPSTKDILDFTQDDAQPPAYEHAVVRQESIVYEGQGCSILKTCFETPG